MSQHIINWQPEDDENKLVVMMFGWDTHFSQLFAQYHIEEKKPDAEGILHFEAKDNSLSELNLRVKPTFIVSNKLSVIESVRDNIQTLMVEAGICLSHRLIETIDTICHCMIEDATDPRYRLRIKQYEV